MINNKDNKYNNRDLECIINQELVLRCCNLLLEYHHNQIASSKIVTIVQILSALR